MESRKSVQNLALLDFRALEIRGFGERERGFEDRSAMVGAKSLPCLLLRRQ
jgi:hypothetical protein